MIMSTRMRYWQARNDRPPPNVPRWLTERAFREGEVPAVRLFARAFGARAGIEPARLADFVLAVSEAMACAAAGKPRIVRVRLWMTGTRAFCEIRAEGLLLRRAPSVTRPGGEEQALRSRVLLQITDNISVAVSPDGFRVILSMTVVSREDRVVIPG